MSESKKRYEVVQPQLSEYPVKSVPGTFEVLKAHTVMKWDEHWWFFVAKVKTTSRGKESMGIQAFKFEWRQPTSWDSDSRRRVPTGDFKWIQDQSIRINGKEQWEDFKKAVELML